MYQKFHKFELGVSCCCFENGSCEVKSYFNKNFYTIGETSKLCVEINNSKSKLDIIDAKVLFINKLLLKSDSGLKKVI